MQLDKEQKREIKRKIVHMSVGLFSLLLRYLSLPLALFCAFLAFINNAFILPRLGGEKIYRASEKEKGYPLGILLYPITVFLLILIYHNHFYIAASIWAIMAFGDGSAALIGTLFGKHKLAWNKEKSYEGTISYIIFGSLGASFLGWWTSLGKPTPPLPFLYNFVFIPIIVTFISALLESYPIKLDDNLTIPLLGSFLMYSFYQIKIPLSAETIKANFLNGVILTVIFALVSFLLRTVDLLGLFTGIFIGVSIYTFLGLKGFIILASFFILGSLSTKLGYKEKEEKGLAEKRVGARGWKNAISKCGVGTIVAPFAYFCSNEVKVLYIAAFVASFAAAAMDTVSSEIGQWKGKRTFSLVSFKEVKPGSEGAISLEGTLAGLIAAVIVAGIAVGLNLIEMKAALIIILSAIIANIIESYMGTFFESKNLADKESVNFLNTLSAAVISYWLYSF